MADMPRLLAAHAYSAANWLALHARRHMHLYGTTKEQLGWLAVNSRRNAALNPRAAYRDPLTMDDYLSARMISEPFGLLDCDVPVDGSVAFVVSAADTRRSTDHPVRVDACGGRRGSGDGTSGPTTRRWRRSTRRPRCGAGPTSGRRTSTSPSSTTASRSSPSPGSRRSDSAATARPGPSSKARPASPSTGAAAQHLRRPTLGRPHARLLGPPRGVPPAARRGRDPPIAGATGGGRRGRRPHRRVHPAHPVTPTTAGRGSVGLPPAIGPRLLDHQLGVPRPLLERCAIEAPPHPRGHLPRRRPGDRPRPSRRGGRSAGSPTTRSPRA